MADKDFHKLAVQQGLSCAKIIDAGGDSSCLKRLKLVAEAGVISDDAINVEIDEPSPFRRSSFISSQT